MEEIEVYITTCALGSGIKKIKGNKISNETINVVNYYIAKPNWHETLEEAIARAEQMRVEEIESLEYKIKQLKEIKFKIF